jgi:hypothetical protein
MRSVTFSIACEPIVPVPDPDLGEAHRSAEFVSEIFRARGFGRFPCPNMGEHNEEFSAVSSACPKNGSKS